MLTEAPADTGVLEVPDAFVDAWAAVFMDVYEKLKERGELPDDAGAPTSPQIEEKLQATANVRPPEGVAPCPVT